MIIVFLGPSLPRAEAQGVLKADYRGPARQGDVFRAIEAKPAAVVLIDGVFESAPSVWHHELMAAHLAGIELFGASSMGALRAAELPSVVKPVGEIARRFCKGLWNDDAHVALLHADQSHGFRPLTLAYVNVWATARAARKAKVLSATRAAQLTQVAESMFYQSRTWASVFAALAWPNSVQTRLQQFIHFNPIDLKADDARACLKLVASTRLRAFQPQPSRLSSFVRRSRFSSGVPAQADEGVRRLLLAEFGRHSGLSADAARVGHWRSRLAVDAADVRETWAESLALEEMILACPERFVPDGPSRAEGAALMRALLPPEST
jgi:hypothetical protein